MKNMKFWRTALVATLVLTVMLSVTGGTIAWFTDSVTSEVNTIKAGNLDVELEYKTDWENEWAPVTEETKLFSDSATWEPGHTEIVALRIKNAGSLALKYDLKVKINSETTSTNVYGKEFKLSDYLEVWNSAINGDGMVGDYWLSHLLSGREYIGASIMNKIGFDTSIVNSTNTINAGEGAHVMALVITMPTTVGNEANHMTGVDAPSISFGIEVEATQHTHEEDSFGMDYDEDALFPGQVDNAEDLSNAMGNGDDVELGDDIETPAAQKSPYGNDVGFIQKGGVFDGNGKTLTVTGSGSTYGILTYGGTIKNVTIKGGERSIVLYSPTEDVILDNVTLDDAGYPINTAEHPTVEGIDLIVSNSTINGWSSFAGIASASFTNCSFGENTNAYWGDMGYSAVYDRLVKPYVTTTFDGCQFDEMVYIDLSALGDDCTVTFKNCTVNGKLLTAELMTTAEDVAGKLTYELPGGERTFADCIIIK